MEGREPPIGRVAYEWDGMGWSVGWVDSLVGLLLAQLAFSKAIQRGLRIGSVRIGSDRRFDHLCLCLGLLPCPEA